MTTSATMADKKNLNPTSCPLCGGPNQCALTADPSATECWCDSVEFPDEQLALVPNAAKRKICICQECVTNFQSSTKAA